MHAGRLHEAPSLFLIIDLDTSKFAESFQRNSVHSFFGGSQPYPSIFLTPF